MSERHQVTDLSQIHRDLGKVIAGLDGLRSDVRALGSRLEGHERRISELEQARAAFDGGHAANARWLALAAVLCMLLGGLGDRLIAIAFHLSL